MKVSSINFSHNITFKSEPLAYDDEVSRERRNFIRSHLDSLNFGYSDIYEKEPRLEEYELNKLVKFLLIMLLSTIILLIGVSRIYLGVHYTSDVIAGFSLSLAYLLMYINLIYKKNVIK